MTDPLNLTIDQLLGRRSQAVIWLEEYALRRELLGDASDEAPATHAPHRAATRLGHSVSVRIAGEPNRG